MTETTKPTASPNTRPTDRGWLDRFADIAEVLTASPTLCRTPHPVLVKLRPRSREALKEILAHARQAGTSIFPVSTGKNWGYGSFIPPRRDSVIVELSGLATIDLLDRESMSVRIEPGVTQEALDALLAAQAPDLTFNVTGAGLRTSVLGNALERGIGYYGEKDRDLFDLEVLLADGSLVRSSPSERNPAHARGAGLAIDELWFQSNLGIVLSARLRLRLRQESEAIVLVQGNLKDVILSLKAAYANRLLDFPTHVAEPGRSQRIGRGLLKKLWNREPTEAEVARSFPERDLYSGLVGIHGLRSVNKAKFSGLKRLLRGDAKAQMSHLKTLRTASTWFGRLGLKAMAARLAALEPLVGLTWGKPTDAGLSALDGNDAGDPDRASRGAIYGNAILACEHETVSAVSATLRAHWADVASTWIVLNDHTIIAIYTLHFAHADAERAHGANQILVQSLREKGFPPYRLDITTLVAHSPAGVVERLKAALDPERLLSPGRYEAAP